jgi:hypothetical protein
MYTLDDGLREMSGMGDWIQKPSETRSLRVRRHHWRQFIEPPDVPNLVTAKAMRHN